MLKREKNILINVDICISIEEYEKKNWVSAECQSRSNLRNILNVGYHLSFFSLSANEFSQSSFTLVLNRKY